MWSRIFRAMLFGALLSCGGGSKDGGPTAPVTPTSVLTTLSVSLSAPSIPVGQTATASATGTDQNGASIATGTMTWSTGSSAVATVNASGLVTGVAPGTTPVIGTAGGKQGQQTITVTQVPVASVAVSPLTASLAIGATQQLTATAKDAGGNVLAGRVITWSGSALDVATVSPSGLVTAVAVGSGTITATSETKSGVAAITVNPSPMTVSGSIGSSGGTVTMPTGTTVTVPAGTLVGAGTLQVTESPQQDRSNAADPTWGLSMRLSSPGQSADTSLHAVTVSVALQGAVQAGKALVLVVTDSTTGATRFGVAAGVASGVAATIRPARVQPRVAAGIIGFVVDYYVGVVLGKTIGTAVAQLVDQNAANCAGIAQLTRVNTAKYPPLGAPRGAVILVHGIRLFDRCQAAVDAPLLQRVAGNFDSIYGDFSEYKPENDWTAMVAAIKTDPLLKDNVDVWVYKYPTTLSPNDNGLDLAQRVAREPGLPQQAGKLAVVAHSMGGLVARVWDRNDASHQLAGIVTLATPHFGAIAADWSIAQRLVPSPGLDGLKPYALDAIAPLPVHAPYLHAIRGGVPCRASFGDFPLSDPQMAVLYLLALGLDCNSPSDNVSDGVVAHTSALPSAANTTWIAPQTPGEIVSHLQVPTNQSAIASTVSELKIFFQSVLTAPVASVSISPAAATVTVGNTQSFIATVKDANGTPLTGRTVVWSSSNLTAATVNSTNGLATGIAAGVATITATSEGRTATASLTVSVIPVATVTLSPAAASIAAGGTQQFAVALKDASGNTLVNRPVMWTSSNTSVATVSVATGLATGLAVGSATITAASEGKTGTSALTVTASTVVYQPGPLDGQDVWINSAFNYGGHYGLDDEQLQVGGWADLYYSLLRFDLTGLPAHASSASIVLQPFSRGDASTAVPMTLYSNLSTWNDSTGWFTQPNAVYVGALPTPVIGTPYVIDVTTLYNGWQSGEHPNFGVELRPTANNNQFNVFRSAEYLADPSRRPKLVIVP